MGGSVKVVTRLSNGDVTIQNRWTNSLHSWFDSIEFTQNSDKLLTDFIKKGEDSEYNDDKNPTLAPEGYGLIVLDNVSKKIYTYQDYTSFSYCHTAGISLNLHLHKALNFKLKNSEIPFIDLNIVKNIVTEQNKIFAFIQGETSFDEELDEIKRFYNFFMNGHIKLSEEFITTFPMKWKSTDVVKKRKYLEFSKKCGIFQKRTIEDWQLLLELVKIDSFFLEYDYSPMEVQDYYKIKIEGSDYETSVKLGFFLDDLKNAGFEFDKADLDQWEEFCADYEE